MGKGDKNDNQKGSTPTAVEDSDDDLSSRSSTMKLGRIEGQVESLTHLIERVEKTLDKVEANLLREVGRVGDDLGEKVKKAEGDLGGRITKLEATTVDIRSKVDFAQGAVWLLGAAIVVFGGAFSVLFWLALDGKIENAVNKAFEKRPAAQPPTVVVQVPPTEPPKSDGAGKTTKPH